MLHEKYGVHDQVAAQAVSYAEHHTLLETVDAFNVSLSTVSRWKAALATPPARGLHHGPTNTYEKD